LGLLTFYETNFFSEVKVNNCWSIRDSGLGAVTSASDAGGSADGDVIATGDFRLDLRTRQVTIRGQDLHLTEEEFEMLVFMIGHPKSIITPQTRLTTRWGSGNLIRQSDFLRVMAQLRRKLDAAGCSHYIRTEPWVVYRFDPHHHSDVH
jgi:two-component system, OmpR family, KDP operon response regulator KdpE